MASDRLLILDDEAGIAKLVARIGATCGFRPIVTEAAAAFKAALAEEPPGVVVLDLAMPDEDGIEILRFLAELRCRAAILLMSGFDTKILQAARRLGEARGLLIAGTITKPARAEDLRAALAAARTVAESDAHADAAMPQSRGNAAASNL